MNFLLLMTVKGGTIDSSQAALSFSDMDTGGGGAGVWVVSENTIIATGLYYALGKLEKLLQLLEGTLW